jgi:hypothetical protein
MDSKRNSVLIVGVNTNKQDAYMACRRGEVTRVAHGVYFPLGQQSPGLLQIMGIRLAKYFFPQSALTHTSAWSRELKNNTAFVGGDYPYKKQVIIDNQALCIMQSKVQPQLDNEALYTEQPFQDPLGSFTMHCATPELVAIQQMDATKQNMEKHLNKNEEAQLFRFLLAKYKDRIALLSALEQVAEMAGKQSQFERLLKQFFQRRFTMEGVN